MSDDDDSGTAADLLRSAERHRKRAQYFEDMSRVERQAEAQDRELAALASELEETGALHADADAPLPIGVDSGTVNAMNATEKSADALRSASRSAYKDNAFVKARGERGETIGDVKTLLEEKFPDRRFHQNVIQAWYVPVGEKSHRDCPIEVREFLRDHYGKFTTGPRKGAWRVALDSWPLERGR